MAEDTDYSGYASSASSLIGGIVGGYQGWRYGNLADKKAFERQEWLMSHAHQMEVADLRAAGLNPILSAGGSGAHGQSVSNTAAAAASSGAGVGAEIGRSMSLLSLKEMQSRIDANKASSARDLAQAEATRRSTDVEYGKGKDMKVDLGDGQVFSFPDDGLKGQMVRKQIELMDQQAKSAGYQNIRAAIEAGYYEKHGDWIVPMQMLIEGTGAAGKSGINLKKLLTPTTKANKKGASSDEE